MNYSYAIYIAAQVVNCWLLHTKQTHTHYTYVMKIPSIFFYDERNTLYTLDMFFSSNHNVHKSSCDLGFWASDPLIGIFLKNLLIKGSEAQKQRAKQTLMNIVI